VQFLRMHPGRPAPDVRSRCPHFVAHLKKGTVPGKFVDKRPPSRIDLLLPGTSVMDVLIATRLRQKENPMTSESKTNKPEAETLEPKRKAGGKHKSGKRQPRSKKGKPKKERANKKAEVIALMKTRQRREAGRDHESHWLASAHGARLRQHPR